MHQEQEAATLKTAIDELKRRREKLTTAFDDLRTRYEGGQLPEEKYRVFERTLIGDKSYDLFMRLHRDYKPFSLTLLKATHEKYPGTEIPKDFRSRVRLEHPGRGERREVEVYMNHPLRYEGLTFFQYQMAADEAVMQAGMTPSSTFQVVRNPSRLTPYLSCALVSLGLVVQFLSHLIPFLKRKVRP